MHGDEVDVGQADPLGPLEELPEKPEGSEDGQGDVGDHEVGGVPVAWRLRRARRRGGEWRKAGGKEGQHAGLSSVLGQGALCLPVRKMVYPLKRMMTMHMKNPKNESQGWKGAT